jgi:putative endonuclease
MTYSVYILECADKSYYTGSTSDIAKRLAAHNAGRGAVLNAGDILSGNYFYRNIAGERTEILKMTLLK